MIGLLLTGCGTVPQGGTGLSDAKRQQFSYFHTQAAVTRQQQGHLHQALLHWQILATAEPHNQKLRLTIDRLKRQIDTRTAAKVLRARESVRKGQLKQARSEFLAVLVLDPDHSESVEQLRKLVSQAMQHKEGRRAASPRLHRAADNGEPYSSGSEGGANPEPTAETRAQRLPTDLQRFRRLHDRGRHQDLIEAVADAKYTAAIPGPLENWLLQAYLGVAQSLRSQGRLRASLDLIDQAWVYSGQEGLNQAFRRKVRRQIAVSLYAQGKEHLKSDINQAIGLWQQALEYDPGYSEVRFQLEKAFRNRDNQRR